MRHSVKLDMCMHPASHRLADRPDGIANDTDSITFALAFSFALALALTHAHPIADFDADL
jgi:hypothetical protein